MWELRGRGQLEVKINNFAIFKQISSFSTPKCYKYKIDGSYSYPNFQIEVKCGSYEAEVNWRSKTLTLPFLNRLQCFQLRNTKKEMFFFQIWCLIFQNAHIEIFMGVIYIIFQDCRSNSVATSPEVN